MQISVVICSYNRANYIGEALDAMYNQAEAYHAYEVIIVDNNSTDHTKEVYDTWRQANPLGNFYYYTETQQGASFARNTGAQKAKGDYLCFVDDDAIAAKDFIHNILSHIEKHPSIVGFGGRIIPRYIPSEPKWMSYYVSSMVGNFDYAPIAKPFENNKYPLESNMIVKKAVFDQVGGFNTELPGVVGTKRIGGEGKELFFKIMKLGHTIYYDPSIQVEHIVEVSKLTKEYLYRVASGMGRGEKNRTLAIGVNAYILKFLEYLFKLGAAIILGIGYALKGRPAQTWPIIQFRIDTLKGLIGL